jgi:hypothetical protein
MAREMQQPSYRAYVVTERDDKDNFWLPIGAAFAHQDGKGFNLILNALPVGTGKIVLREMSDDDREQPADAANGNVSNVSNVRSYKERRADQRGRRG